MSQHPSLALQARSQFKSRSTANNVSILVPVPSDADSPRFKTSMGSAKWVPEQNVVQWTIKSFPVRLTGLTSWLPLKSQGLCRLPGHSETAGGPLAFCDR